VDKQPVLRMSIGSELEMLGAATLNACLAASVCVLGTNRHSPPQYHNDNNNNNNNNNNSRRRRLTAELNCLEQAIQ